MYAIVKTGGKQYKVAEGDVIEVEKLAGAPGDAVKLTAVLLVDGDDLVTDAAKLAEVAVSGEIAAHTKAYEDRFLSPFVAAERGYVDEVIMPHSTRRRVARALKMLRNKDLQNPWKKHDNIPL